MSVSRSGCGWGRARSAAAAEACCSGDGRPVNPRSSGSAFDSTRSVAAGRNVAIDQLRVFVVLLVIAHHGAMAYRPSAPPPATSLLEPPMAWLAFPLVDERRWLGFDVLVAVNDLFFMALMFFVSGLFVWRSLVRKGALAFARDRLRRLGIPFVVASAVLGPLAYYPAYRQSGAAARGEGFWSVWLGLPHWPSGPVWFLWVLLVFDSLAASLRAVLPGYGDALCRLLERSRSPVFLFCALVAASAAVYVPLALAFGAGTWTNVGPFTFQNSRPLLYALYFLAGLGVGAMPIDRGILAEDGTLARRWPRWLLVAIVTVVLAIGLLATIAGRFSRGEPPSVLLDAVFGLSFVTACAAASFLSLSVFVRFARAGGLLERLRDEAYGMFVVHFAFVSWLQYALLESPVSAVVKGGLVITGAVLLSWATTAALRRIPAVASVL